MVDTEGRLILNHIFSIFNMVSRALDDL